VNFELSEDDRAFRARIRTWLAGNLDPDWLRKAATRDDWADYQRYWDRALFRGGWAGLWWPREHGGMGATASQKAIFELERARAGAPEGLAFFGRRLLGPGIMKFGDEAQRQLLPKILAGDIVFCQGSSEPDAGSDLAGVRTTARLRGDQFVITGRKIWTSWAQYADMCFMLVRTDPTAPKHAGLTLLLVEMRQPGIEIRPLRKLTGNADFTEVIIDGAKAPASAVLGGPGRGWEVMRYLLTYERGATSVFGRLIRMDEHLREYAKTALADAAERGHYARLATEIATARLLVYKILSTQMAGGEPGAAGSVVKLYWSRVWQELAERSLLSGGSDALASPYSGPDAADFPTLFLDSRCATISGGSSEIQRTIVARRVLGLPRSGSLWTSSFRRPHGCSGRPSSPPWARHRPQPRPPGDCSASLAFSRSTCETTTASSTPR
jgi:alkylation response protein AidB-like acyl-CoA dehydrogenase